MRGVTQRRLGGPEVLELTELDRPAPSADQVLVRVRAAGVNPADAKIRSGAVRRLGPPPFTLGLDLSGVVEEVGSVGLPFEPGDEVFGVTYPPLGSYAQYSAVTATALARKPAGLDHPTAAALPVTSLTAWQALVTVAGVRAGQRVLVHAAAGGIGHLAVQIAKTRGAHVTGTARAANHAFLRELGADDVVDYTTVDFAATVRDVDIVLDPIAGEYSQRSLDTLVPGGLLIDVRGTGPDRTAVRAAAQERGLRFVEFGFTPSGADLALIAESVRRGDVRVAVEHIVPLDRVATAHELIESGHTRGKIVLTV
jgi:NADPH:quinone reductase-like Zn-dependent oxidoreductase